MTTFANARQTNKVFSAMAESLDRNNQPEQPRRPTERELWAQLQHKMAIIDDLMETIADLKARLEQGRARSGIITIQEAAGYYNMHESTVWRHLTGKVREPRVHGYFDQRAGRWYVQIGTESDPTND